jgi:DNA-binding NtrC family response regulator
MVLIVEDEMDVAFLVQTILSAHDITSLVASTREKALELLAGDKPDFALLDIWMGELGIQEFIAKLKNLAPNCKLVFMTADGVLGRKLAEEHNGKLIKKPFELTQLLEAVKD